MDVHTFQLYTQYPGIGFTRTDLVELKSSRFGYGLFASKDIPKNTRLTSWSGRLLNETQLHRASANVKAYAISLRNNTGVKVDGFALRDGVVNGEFDVSRIGIGWLANSGAGSCRTEYISQSVYRKLLHNHGFSDEEVSQVTNVFNHQIIMLTSNRIIAEGEELTHTYSVRESVV